MSATNELHMGQMGIQLGQQITLSKQEWKKEYWVFCEGGIWAGIEGWVQLGSIYTNVSQRQHYWHFGSGNSLYFLEYSLF